MNRCVIFAAGEMTKTELLPTEFLPGQDYIIAADAGLKNSNMLSISPDLVIGDMDSLPHDEVPEGAILFPVRKDDTDLMLAVRDGLSLGYKNFLIYGAFGGRLDHTYASIQTLGFIKDHGGTGIIADGLHWATMLENESIILPRGYRHVSVFSYTEHCAGVCLRGLSYPLENGELSQNFPIGVSNAYDKTGDSAEVSVREGRLLIILSNLT